MLRHILKRRLVSLSPRILNLYSLDQPTFGTFIAARLVKSWLSRDSGKTRSWLRSRWATNFAESFRCLFRCRIGRIPSGSLPVHNRSHRYVNPPCFLVLLSGLVELSKQPLTVQGIDTVDKL